MLASKERQGVRIAAVTLFTALAAAAAWMSDEAFVIARVADNIAHGLGLVWNPGERVQVTDGPLWLAIVTIGHALASSPYWMLLTLNLTFAALAIWVASRALETKTSLLAALILLSSSRVVVDYATGGLSTSLVWLLLSLLVQEARSERSRPERMALWTGLVLLTQMDLALFVIPLGLGCIRAQRTSSIRDSVRWLGQALLPIGIWVVFSVFYYGMALPNPAYAFINRSEPVGEVASQGLRYFVDFLYRDPVGSICVLAFSAIALRSRGPIARGLLTGWVFYASYVLWLGGSDASGELFAPMLFTLLVELVHLGAQTESHRRSNLTTAFALGVLGAVLPTRPTWHVPAGPVAPGHEGLDGIADRAAAMSTVSSPWLLGGQEPLAEHPGAIRGKAIAGVDALASFESGLLGYYAGKYLQIIQTTGLYDPLLARLPTMRLTTWTPARPFRTIPKFYRSTAITRPSELELYDPALGRCLGDLKLAVGASLFAPGRWSALWRLNTATGCNVDEKAYRYADKVVKQQDLAGVEPPDGSSTIGIRARAIPDEGLRVRLTSLAKEGRLHVSLDGDDVYELQQLRGTMIVATQYVGPTRQRGQTTYKWPIAEGATIDAVRILPIAGDGVFVVSHVAVAQSEKAR